MLTTTNLIHPDECDEPFPVPDLTRTYRVWVPWVDLVAPGSTTVVAAPHGPTASIRFNAFKAVQAETPGAVFGGVPLNALDTADDPRWLEPTLAVIEVADPVSLIRNMSIDVNGVAVSLDIGSEHVTELLESGSTIVPRVGSGYVKLELGAGAVKPPVVWVADFEEFLADPSAVLPSRGRPRSVRVPQATLADLARGKPVVFGTGGNAAFLMRPVLLSEGNDGGESDTPATSGTSSGRTASSTTPPPDTATTTEPNRTTTEPPPPPPPPPPSPPQLALLLPIDQTWELQTYERGWLMSSISLTPQEEVTVDVYSWDRRKTSREDTTTFDSEANAESQTVDRDTRDVFGELSKNGNFGYGLGGSFSGYGLTIGGNINSSNTVNKIAKATVQKFHEETGKASAKVHTSRQLKITESTEQGSENRVTRKLRNNNLCHPVTYHYFELAARYVVATGCAKQETVFVLLVDNPLARPTYDVDFVRTYESVLRRALLDPAFADGFEAARILWMLSHATPVICNDCVCPEDLTGSESTEEFAQAVSAIKALGDAVAALLRLASRFEWSGYFYWLIPPATNPGGTTPNPGPGLRQALFVDAVERTAPGLLARLAALCGPVMGTGAVTAAELSTFASQFGVLDVSGIDEAVRPDDAVQAELKGMLEARVRAAYDGRAKATVLDVIAKNGTGNPVIDYVVFQVVNTLTEESAAGVLANAIIASISRIPGLAATDPNGVDHLFKGVTTALAAWTAGVAKDETAAAERRRAHQTTFANTFPPANVLAAQERFDALVRHLLANADYYATVRITDMIARGQLPVPPELLQYLPFVAVQPMTVVNGRLAYAIDLTSSTGFDPAAEFMQAVVDAIPDDKETDEISLPTPGFVVEPKLSCCSACEDFVEQSRHIELGLKTAQADQAKWEAKRRETLIAQVELGPFEPLEPGIKVTVTQEP